MVFGGSVVHAFLLGLTLFNGGSRESHASFTVVSRIIFFLRHQWQYRKQQPIFIPLLRQSHTKVSIERQIAATNAIMALRLFGKGFPHRVNKWILPLNDTGYITKLAYYMHNTQYSYIHTDSAWQSCFVGWWPRTNWISCLQNCHLTPHRCSTSA